MISQLKGLHEDIELSMGFTQFGKNIDFNEMV